MALSENVKSELQEAKGHLRTALRNAAVNEKSFVAKNIADMIFSLDNLEQTEELMDKLENRKSGDNGMFGTFFNDFQP
jgi:predicted nucleic acid-binding protein